MSYSRWTDSRFYTYWECIDDTDVDTRMAIHDAKGGKYVYRPSQGIDEFLESVPNINESEREELKKYINSFITDVNGEKGGAK